MIDIIARVRGECSASPCYVAIGYSTLMYHIITYIDIKIVVSGSVTSSVD
jgi:hypothetical protein